MANLLKAMEKANARVDFLQDGMTWQRLRASKSVLWPCTYYSHSLQPTDVKDHGMLT